MKSPYFLIIALLSFFGLQAQTPTDQQASLPANPTLQDFVNYALANQANVQQALIDQEIGERDIASALSGWFPQISANGSYNYNIKLPTTVFQGNTVALGQKHGTNVTFQADQKILDPSLMQASKAAKYVRQQNAQNTQNWRINTVVSVSKAYYDVLSSEEQLNIIKENIARIQKQLSDAKARYQTGIVDNTDFKRAQITLSNSQAELKSTQETLKYKYAYLKELIGLNGELMFKVTFDNNNMENEIALDTMQQINFESRVEYQQLLTQKQLQHINTQYNKWTFLPTLSAFYNYAFDFRDDSFRNMFDHDYPSSVAGLTLSLPIFQGTKRLQEIRKSKLQEERVDWDIINLKNQINTQYQSAMATYKANLNDWKTAKENVELSKEVYNTIKLQYDEGIKTYLDLMTAETDLRTTQINYLNALYAVLSAKMDVEQALGTVDVYNANTTNQN